MGEQDHQRRERLLRDLEQLRFELEVHRAALHDLREVAAGTQRELLAARLRDQTRELRARHKALHDEGVAIHGKADWPTAP